MVESAKHYFDTKSRKIRNRPKLESLYKKSAENYKNHFGDSDYIGILIRNLRVTLIDGYCREVLRDAYHDAIRVQLCKIYLEYKRLLKILPMDVYKDTFENSDERGRRMVDDNENIENIEFIPTVDEIMRIKGFKEDEKEN